ncbi:hypothetical protein ACOJCM_03835 [Billgrantia sp. LNSP4103-1]|uniref:hypothetical protein n=1 Tax=Billgrantia sp. LNSP4103-1 TaxID=3410266 RepID=UPI00403FB7D9
MIRPTLLKALAWIALLLATLYGLYLVTANALLASDWARNQLDRTPRLTLEWEHAWTAYPGHLQVSELRLAGAAAERRYALEAERATLGVSLVSLLGRELRLHRLDAEGIRQVSLEEYRLQGSGHLNLAGIRWGAGELAVKALQLQLEEGTIREGDTALMQQVDMQAELDLAPLALADHTGPQAARFVSGRVELAGRSDAYDVFNRFFSALGWLEIDGQGEMAGDIRIANGEVQRG